MAMGSPLGPAQANILKHSFKNKWLKDCPHDLKPVFFRQYVIDIFVLVPSLNHENSLRSIYLPNIPT